MVVALAGAFRPPVAGKKKGVDCMRRAIARYGVRTIPGDEKEIVAAFRRGEAVEGPAINEFENRFAEFHGTRHAISASFGRMAFYYILRALELPPESEIIFPALTF